MPSTPLTSLVADATLTTPPRERSWVERARLGEPEALDWLVRQHWDRVQRLIVRMFGPRQDLEDLVQNTFLETLRGLPGFRGDSALSTFISGIAIRVVLRARRPNQMLRHSESGEVDEFSSGDPSAEAHYDRAEALRRLQRVLDRLSEAKRVAFLLWAVEGLPVEEVALATQASVSATRSRIFYAQKALKAAAARDAYLRRWLEPEEGT